MPATTTGPKQLYLASSLEELNLKSDVKDPVQNARMGISTAFKLFEGAEKSRLDGDEEKAYILYMRCVSVIHAVKKHSGFQKEKAFFEEKIGRETFVKCIEYAEKMSNSLRDRYMEQEVEKEMEKEMAEKSAKKVEKVASESKPTVISQPKAATDAGQQQLNITSVQLYSLLSEKKSSFLIVDVRKSSEFNLSHMTLEQLVSVPEEIVKPGCTGNQIEAELKTETEKHKFRQRSQVELVILVDWKSTLINMSPTIKTMKDAITKWQSSSPLRKEPVILEGGYETWTYTYPQLTTKSLLAQPSLTNGINGSSQETPDLNLSYPSLEPPPAPKPEIPPVQQPTSPEERLSAETKTDADANKQSRMTPNIPNRATKPVPKEIPVNLATSPKGSNKASVVPPPAITVPAATVSPVIPPSSLDTSARVPASPDIALKTPKPTINRGSKPATVISSSSDSHLSAAESSFSMKTKQEEAILESLEHKQRLLSMNIEELQKKLLELKAEEEEKNSEKVQNEDNMKKRNETIEKLRQERKMKEFEDQTRREMEEEYSADVEKLKRDKEDMERNYRRSMQDIAEERRMIEERLALAGGSVAATVPAAPVVPPVVSHVAPAGIPTVGSPVAPLAGGGFAAASSSTTLASPSGTQPFKVPLKSEDAPPSSGGLKRSHSSPNIARLLENQAAWENPGVSPSQANPATNYTATADPRRQTPTFSRNLKPQHAEVEAARHRNLQPVYAHTYPGLTGLKNLGNTCFMNSIVQCLNNIPLLAEYFLKDAYRKHINYVNPLGHKGKIAEEFAVVVRALWSGQYRHISPIDLKITVGQCQPMFLGNEQQDAQEFLMFLLDGLSEDLNLVQRRPVAISEKEKERFQQLAERDHADLLWDEHKRFTNSLIVDLFQGQLKQTITCKSCGNHSVDFQVFNCLSLPIRPTSKCTLNECIEGFLQKETVQGNWKCPNCRRHQEATIKLDIWKLPPILIIQFKRFKFEGMWRHKIQSVIHFPIDELDLSKYVPGLEKKRKYQLFAVVNHFGTMEGGHYTALCKNVTTKRWFGFDDPEVNEKDIYQSRTSAAYILFYTSAELRSPSVTYV